MHCDELTDDVLLDLAERRVDPPTQDAVQNHLSRCRPCAQRYIDTAQVLDLAAIALTAAPSAACDARILRGIDASLKPLISLRRQRLACVGAALLFAFAAVGAVVAIQPEPRAYVASSRPSAAHAPAEESRPASAPSPAPEFSSGSPAESPIHEKVVETSVPIVQVEIAPRIPDLNGDGKVDLADLMMVADSINEESSRDLYDLNGDGKVDVADKMLLLQAQLPRD